MPLSKYKVIDVVQQDVSSADPADPARQLFSDIATAQHGCIVVVDGEYLPVGIVTRGDVVRMVLSEQVPGGLHRRAITTSIEATLEHLKMVRRASGEVVAHCMTTPVVTVDEQETLQRVAEIFAENHFDSLPVVRGGRLVGLVRRVDLLGPIMEAHDEAQRARGLVGADGSQQS
ncbi:MAG: CBS domain-containing protein [Dehalococcoidia bacterium]|nr:CBS domain-containing protein [Dehalococcoidia bacterium]